MFLEFYGLREQPFGVTPNPQYLYRSPQHREALAALLYAIENDLGFCAIVAPPGLGKTTLLFQILETLRSAGPTAFIFQTQCAPHELLRQILLELDLAVADKDAAQLHLLFNDFLVAQARSGRRVVIVLDEAQNLPPASLEFVRLLTNFETPCRKLMTVVLSGQPQLADKLSDPALAQLRQRIAVTAHLEPLNQAEVAHYINHRLRVAGHQTGNLFSPAAVGEIAATTGGVPRLINQLCFKALALGCALGRREIDDEVVQEIAADSDLTLLGQEMPPHAAMEPQNAIFSSAAATASTVPPAPKPTPPRVPVANAESKRFVPPVPAAAKSPPHMPVRPGPVLRQRAPLLGSERRETQRQLVLTAVVMLIVAAAGLIWFVAAPEAGSSQSTAHNQPAPQATQPVREDRELHAIPQTTAQPLGSLPANRPQRPAPQPVAQPAMQTPAATAPRASAPQPVTRDADPPPLPRVTMRAMPALPTLDAMLSGSSTVPATPRVAPRPLYPESARQLGVGGRVVVEATIDKNGHVTETQVTEGDPRLRSAAETAVQRWLYSPSQVDGRAVPSKDTIVFYFHPSAVGQNQPPEIAKQGAQ